MGYRPGAHDEVYAPIACAIAAASSRCPAADGWMLHVPSGSGTDGADNTTAVFTPDLDSLLANPIALLG